MCNNLFPSTAILVSFFGQFVYFLVFVLRVFPRHIIAVSYTHPEVYKRQQPTLFDKTIFAGYTAPNETKEGIFRVKLNQTGSVKAKVKLLSTRGGYQEREIVIGQ